MPSIKIKVPSLIGGISQQPPHQRFSNQVEDAVNTIFDVTDGASKRAGTQYLADLSDLPAGGDYQLHAIERNDEERYVTIIGPNGSGVTVLRVLEVSGREATVNIDAAAQTYLSNGNPRGHDFRFASKADYTIIANRTVAAGVTGSGASLDATKMPIQMVRTTPPTNTTAAVFTVSAIAWTARGSGDNTTNPAPQLVNGAHEIADIGFYRNRFVIAGDEHVSMSQAGDFFNFYIEDHANLVDSDPIDVALTADQVSLIDFITPFHKSLVIFTQAGLQFETNTPEALTPTTISIDPTTRYETLDVKPVAAGSMLYFYASRNNGSILYEYLYDDSQLTNVASDLTRHVDRLLPQDMRSLDGSTSNTILLALPNNDEDDSALLTEDGDYLLKEDGGRLLLDSSAVGSNALYAYRYHWSDDEKVQSAWSVYQLGDNDQIADIAVIRNECFMLTRVGDSSTGEFILESLPMGRVKTPDEDMPYVVHLDRQMLLSGTYNGSTTSWTIPSGQMAIDAVVLGPSFGEAAGTLLTPTQNGTTISVSGNYTAGDVYLGMLYPWRVKLTRPYHRDRNGFATIDGDLYIQKVSALHHDTSDYKIRASMPYRQDRLEERDDAEPENGRLEAWFNGDAKETVYQVESTSPRPATLSAFEYDANFLPRA